MMTLETIYEPPVLTFENIHDHCSTVATGLYYCVRCDSNDIDKTFIIKYGLHPWFLCKQCASKFLYLVHNLHALIDVPDGYGQWTFDLHKMGKKLG